VDGVRERVEAKLRAHGFKIWDDRPEHDGMIVACERSGKPMHVKFSSEELLKYSEPQALEDLLSARCDTADHMMRLHGG
jgi:hypothetical protein